MRHRIPWQAFVAFLAALALPIVAPALASAAQTFTLSAATLGAGTDPNLASVTGFDATAGAPQTFTLDLAPGLLVSAAANPACLTAVDTSSVTPGSGCDVGNGVLTTTLPPPSNSIPYNAYIVPATHTSDIAGIEFVTGGATPVTMTGAIDLRTTPTVGLNVSINLSPLGSVAAAMTGMTLSISGSLQGNAFTRLPTSCAPDTSSVTVTYSGASSSQTATNEASPAATPTGCNALSFTPQLAVTATRDKADANVGITISSSQPNALAQSADKTLVLTLPSVLSPNVTNSLGLLNSGKAVGTATATSPLIPSPLSGRVTLTGTIGAPVLTVTFADPVPLSLEGAVGLTSRSVTFNGLPDFPLSNLSMTLNGGGSALFETTCKPARGTLIGAFTGQNGVNATANGSFTIAGCPTAAVPGKPTVSSTILSGLAKGLARVKFTVTAGKTARLVKAFTVNLPNGLKFSSKAKDLKQGVKVSGATVTVSHGALVITLKKPASKSTVTIMSSALVVSGRLANTVKSEVKRHKVEPLTFRLKVTDSARTSTTLSFKVKPTS